MAALRSKFFAESEKLMKETDLRDKLEAGLQLVMVFCAGVGEQGPNRKWILDGREVMRRVIQYIYIVYCIYIYIIYIRRTTMT